MSNRSIVRSMTLALALAGAVAGAQTSDPSLQTRNPGLKIRWAGDQAHTPPFDQVLLAPVELQFRDVAPLSGPPMAPTTRNEFPVSDKDREVLAKVFDEALRDELRRDKHFTLTDQPGPGVLLVKPSLRDIVSRVPPEEPAGSTIYIDSVADATLVVSLVDPVADVTLGTATDRRTAEPATAVGHFGAVRATAPLTTYELRHLAQRWASSLHRRLDQLYFDAKPKGP